MAFKIGTHTKDSEAGVNDGFSTNYSHINIDARQTDTPVWFANACDPFFSRVVYRRPISASFLHVAWITCRKLALVPIPPSAIAHTNCRWEPEI